MENKYTCNCKEMGLHHLNWVCPVHGMHTLKPTYIADWEDEYKKQVSLREGETEEDWMKRQILFIRALLKRTEEKR